jgi:hypothetical protein
METGYITIIASIIAGVARILSRLIEHIDRFSPSAPNYDKDAQVDAIVSLMREKYKCSRVSVLAYHNGGHWIDGSSQSKFTLRHESCNRNTAILMSSLSSVSTTLLKEEPFLLDTKKILFEPDIEKIKEKLEPSYYETMQKFGTTSTIAVAIHRRLFNWHKFKFEVYLIASFHMNWETPEWCYILLANREMQIELIKEIERVTLSYCPKEYKQISRLNTFLDICQNIKLKHNL